MVISHQNQAKNAPNLVLRGLYDGLMEAFLVSTGIVALAEMGDKTQLLSLVLAARFRKPWPIVWGILVATLINHGLAGALGSWVTTQLGPDALRWVLGGSFLAMAVWILVPDKLDDEEQEKSPRFRHFCHNGCGLLHCRNGRQNTSGHRDVGRSIQQLVLGGGRHHLGHDAGQCTCGLVG